MERVRSVIEDSTPKDNAFVELKELPESRGSQTPFDSQSRVNFPPQSAAPNPAWPQEPVQLVPSKRDAIFANAYDAFLFAIPFALIAKIGLVIGAWRMDRGHNGSEIDLVSGLTTFLIEFNGQLVTAFTIVFITIMTTVVRRYALWKAQKGAYVAELEQLHGSISLPSTFKLIYSLRAFSVTSVALIAIWSFYYLGSQASKEEFQRVSSNPFHKLDGLVAGPNFLSGFDPNNPSGSFMTIDDLNDNLRAAENWAKPVTDQIATRWGTDSLGAAILPDLNAITVRGYSNDINLLTGYFFPKKHGDGWVDVAKQSLNKYEDYYTAYVGRRVSFTLFSSKRAIAQQVQNFIGDYEYPIRYLNVGCDKATKLSFDSFVNGTYLNQTVSLNMTAVRADAPVDVNGSPLREFDLWTRWAPSDNPYITSTGSSHQTCNISWVNVEAKIHCQDSGCYPHQMRYANNMSRENATTYSTPFDDDTFAENFFSNLLLSHGAQPNISRPLTFTQKLVNSLPSGLSQDGDQGTYDHYLELFGAGGVNRPLTQYFNTYYMLSQDATGSPSTTDDGSAQTVHIKGAFYDPHYAIFWPWIAVDFVSCLILLAASVLAFILRRKTLAPDIFGYVSSLTRDNHYLELPDNGTTLNGIDRARMLRNVKVKLGDVSKPEESTGRVGLAQIGPQVPVQVVELKPTTVYV